jgi:hypothetical protein
MDWLANTIQEDAEVSVGPQQPLIERAVSQAVCAGAPVMSVCKS